jgi:hypothetical protein
MRGQISRLTWPGFVSARPALCWPVRQPESAVLNEPGTGEERRKAAVDLRAGRAMWSLLEGERPALPRVRCLVFRARSVRLHLTSGDRLNCRMRLFVL